MIDERATKAMICQAIQYRRGLSEDLSAYRLFNGFYEGLPGLTLDRYGETLVIFDHNDPAALDNILPSISGWVMEDVKGLESVLLKRRQDQDDKLCKGILLHGTTVAHLISENKIAYAVDLRMNQDASFYLDTRNLRDWLQKHLLGKSVLNTFAYTGSLGVAAGVGGASAVIQTDINQTFLKVAQCSWALNHLPSEKCDIIAGDFFRVMGHLRHQERLFDCVILDPPFFSSTEAGRVDLQHEMSRLVNKVRPLVAHEGWLVVINNALFYSGADFISELDALCQSQYLEMEGLIPVPMDVTGYPETVVSSPPVSPEPFNHSTKIAVLKVFRKDGRK